MNTAYWKSLALGLVLVLAWPLSAAAIGTVTHGDVTFGYTNDFNTTRGNTVDTRFTGAAAGDLTWESWWFFRVQGDGSETAFGHPDAEDYSLYGGSVGRLDWNDPGGAGLFSAVLAFEVRDTGVNSGLLFQSLRVTNTSLAALTIDLFHYTDLDLSSSFGGDSASIVANPDGIEMRVTDGANFSPIIGYAANAYEITAYSTVLRDLTDANRDDLNNTGDGFGPGDFTGAFQWSVTIGVGQSLDFLTQFGSDTSLADPTTSPIPESNTGLLLALGLLGLAVRPHKSL